MEQLYYSGEEIHIGDQVGYAGHPGEVVFVVDRGEYSPDFQKKTGRTTKRDSWSKRQHMG